MAMTANTDLFGREIIDAMPCRQMDLFHIPLSIPRPPVERVGSRSATDPRHTLILSAGMAKLLPDLASQENVETEG